MHAQEPGKVRSHDVPKPQVPISMAATSMGRHSGPHKDVLSLTGVSFGAPLIRAALIDAARSLRSPSEVCTYAWMPEHVLMALLPFAMLARLLLLVCLVLSLVNLLRSFLFGSWLLVGGGAESWDCQPSSCLHVPNEQSCNEIVCTAVASAQTPLRVPSSPCNGYYW
jgi:hypothetical protein